MRRTFSILAVCLLVAGCGGASLFGDKVAATKPMPLDAGAAAAAISRYRVAHGLSPVTVDARLMQAAERQARAVAEVGYLSHEVGGRFPKRLAWAGFGGRYAAENLGAGAHSMDQVLARWQASPEHNKNLLMPQAQRIGIARVDAPETRLKQYWALVLSDG
jgi:uncharacterized protein YkwD